MEDIGGGLLGSLGGADGNSGGAYGGFFDDDEAGECSDENQEAEEEEVECSAQVGPMTLISKIGGHVERDSEGNETIVDTTVTPTNIKQGEDDEAIVISQGNIKSESD